MAYADAFAPPRGIGQGLTSIVAPNYAMGGGRGDDSSLRGDDPAPFAPGGAFDPRLDEAQEGLAKLFQPQSQANASGIDSISSLLPAASAASSLGSSPATTAAPSSQSANGLGRLVGPASNGQGNGVSPQLTQTQQAIGSAKTANQAVGGLFGLTGGGVTGSPGAVSGINAGVGTGAGLGDNGVGAATLGSEGLEGGVSGSGLAGTSGGAGALIGGGLSAAGLLALLASMAQRGQASPGELAGLAQSAGGVSSNLSSILGPAQAGTEAGALSGTLGPELAAALGLGGQVLGGAGALGSVGLSLANEFNALHNAQEDPRLYASAGGSELGLAAGGIIGSIISPGYGTLLGLGVGGAAGTAIGQGIAKNLPVTHYMAQRQHWGEVATDAVNAYGFGIQKAASNGGLSEIQQAMSQRYADGHVGAYLTLPDAVAQAIGVPTQTTFDSLSPEQFVMVLKAASQTDPAEYERWIGAQGDVQYLEQGRAQGVAEATQKTATATLTALMRAYQPLLAQLPAVAPEALEASRVWAAGAGARDLERRGIAPDAYARSLEQAGIGS